MKPLVLATCLLATTPIGLFANPDTTVVISGDTKVELVWIEPGIFIMGSPDSEPDPPHGANPYEGAQNEHPQHKVAISHGFWMGKYEVTQRQWEAVMGSPPWSDKYVLPGTIAIGPDYPAIEVSWTDTQLFIHQLNSIAGDSLFRLPTEAEWEYACRAGTTTRWSFGDEESKLGEYALPVGLGGPDDSYALKPLVWMNEVGTKLPNPWGLYDMHGNAMEWVQDWFGAYRDSAQVDPVQTKRPEGPAFTPWYRMMRGGARGLYVGWTRSAFRFAWPLWNHSDFTGFRLVYTAPRLLDTAVMETEDEGEFSASPRAFSLFQNYPNPFNGTTQIRIWLSEKAWTSVDVFDLGGQRIAILEEGFRGPGYYENAWNGCNSKGIPLGTGTYIIRLRSGKYYQTKKALLVR